MEDVLIRHTAHIDVPVEGLYTSNKFRTTLALVGFSPISDCSIRANPKRSAPPAKKRKSAITKVEKTVSPILPKLPILHWPKGTIIGGLVRKKVVEDDRRLCVKSAIFRRNE